jgi:hypothetical protein
MIATAKNQTSKVTIDGNVYHGHASSLRPIWLPIQKQKNKFKIFNIRKNIIFK